MPPGALCAQKVKKKHHVRPLPPPLPCVAVAVGRRTDAVHVPRHEL